MDLNKQFQALWVTKEEGGRFTRTIIERNIDDLPAGDVVIRVAYSSLNYKDALSATGNRGVTRNYPHTPGIDAAGVVVESRVDDVQPGEQVLVTGFDLGMNTAGGFGQYIRVPASWVVKCPPGLTIEKTMMYGTAGLTAALSVHRLLESGVRPEDGEILVTGSTGGVGSIAVAILAKLGFSVTAGTGKNDQTEWLYAIGAKNVTSRDELDDTSGKPLLKPRWAGAIDTVGGNLLSTAIRSTQYGGAVTTCGNVASPDFTANVFPFILKGVSLLGVDSVQCPMDLRKKMWAHLAGDWNLDLLEQTIQRVALADLDTKIEEILKGKALGRTLVILP